MKTLVFESEKWFYLRELARKIGVTPVYVKKELYNLKKTNLIIESRQGNQILFQINKNCLIFPEIKNLFLKTEFFPELLKKKLESFKIDFAFIFGSFASGEEKKESDIDLFVIGDIKENELLEIIRFIQKKTEREINYILWKKKLLLKRAKKHHLLNEIAKKPIIMIVGNENEFRKIIQ